MSKKRAPYPAWIYRQSALVPYRWDGGELNVLLITSRRSRRWVVPKGIVEPGMSPIASALKEAQEEAGVTGRAHDRLLGKYRQDKWGGTCEIAVYPLEVTDQRDDWPEAQSRERCWFPVSDAARVAGRKGLRRIIERLRETVPEPSVSPVTETAPLMRARIIYLLRHAKYSRDDPELADQDRPLTPRGERACEAMSRYMALGEVRPDLVLCSSALRARQTLERVMPARGEYTPVVEHSSGLYLADPRALLDRLRGCPENASSVMLVGHNPGLQALALQLAGSTYSESRAQMTAMAAKYPPGSLTILVHPAATWAELDPRGCELHSFVRPRDIGAAP